MASKLVLRIVLFVGTVASHMQMSWPYPLGSQYDPENNPSNIDYSMTNPLDRDGSNFPCKGYHHNTPWRPTAEYVAGERYNITLSGSARHGGGSCQLSLSYNDGKTFKVIKSWMGGCPLESEIDFRMPDDVVNGPALFAWSWFNLVGNWEMYMNCADVIIHGGSGNIDSFTVYPGLFLANVGNGCSTVEGKHTVFTHPGNQVFYADGIDASTPPFPNC